MSANPPASAPAGQILIVGAGYVGLTAAVCFAQQGRMVICADLNSQKVELLCSGVSPIHEPGMAELLARGLESGRLRFTSDVGSAAAQCEFAFLCVQTPLGADGTTDDTNLLAAAACVGATLPADAVVVSKSTVPVGGHEAVVKAVARGDIAVAANPEFLREGNAVQDFLNPDRVVIGVESPRTADRVAALYDWIKAPIILTDPASAEVAKFAANAFLATKVSFVNELAAVCEAVDADIDDVLTAVGADHRIGSAYLQPGPGWGGSCLPKDTRALVSATRSAGYVFDLLEGAIRANELQLERVIEKVATASGSGTGASPASPVGASPASLAGLKIGVLGLTFKAGTDDLRGSAAVEIAQRMASRGAKLSAYDPCVKLSPHSEPPPELAGMLAGQSDGNNSLELCDSIAEVARGADVLVVLTEWPEFAACDWSTIAPLMKTALVVDARNLLDQAKMLASGFVYEGLGRSARRLSS